VETPAAVAETETKEKRVVDVDASVVDIANPSSSSNPTEVAVIAEASGSSAISWEEKRQRFVDCQDLKNGRTAFMIAISQRLDLDQPQDYVTEAFRALKANPQIKDKVSLALWSCRFASLI
jgi:hypothetical protein